MVSFYPISLTWYLLALSLPEPILPSKCILFSKILFMLFFSKQKLREKYVCKIDMRNKMSCSFDWSVSGFHRAMENAVWGVATDVFLKVPDTVRCNSWGSYVILFDVESKGKVLTYLPRANLLGDRKLLFLGLTLQEFFSENISDDKEKKLNWEM